MLTGSKGLSFHGLGWPGASYFRTGRVASPFIHGTGSPVLGPSPIPASADPGPLGAGRPPLSRRRKTHRPGWAAPGTAVRLPAVAAKKDSPSRRRKPGNRPPNEGPNYCSANARSRLNALC